MMRGRGAELMKQIASVHCLREGVFAVTED